MAEPARTLAQDPRLADADQVRWTRCPSCRALVYLRRLRRNGHVCPDCAHHMRMGVHDRIGSLLDDGSFERFGADVAPVDVLGFTDSRPYTERLAQAQRRSGSNEAVLCGTGTIDGAPVVVAALDFGFLGGSVGGVTGELVARAARTALDRRTPLVLVCASGGARMQEGTISLMQLAKTSQEVARLREAGVLVVSIGTDPTYGGVTASFGMLGDVVVAEPGARIGFAGPQVIRQTIRQELPAGFQTAEYLRDAGMVDLVVPRHELRTHLARLLRVHSGGPAAPAAEGGYRTRPRPAADRDASEVLHAARDIGRPSTSDYCARIFEDFVELHGDRLSDDDPAVIAGIGTLGGRPVVVVGHQKGHETAELVQRNFGMPQPAGYHKARRMMDYAERFGFPLVTFVDTPGAYPGVDAEQRGQGTAIAECISRMARLKVPAVSVVTGEGGSGGALALGVGNEVLVLENAYYSVISPEGCSTILWGTAERTPQAAEQLRITADDLLRLGVVDGVVDEPAGGAQQDHAAMAARLAAALRTSIGELSAMDGGALLDQRRRRFDRFGDPDHSDSEVQP
ncbi:acetyl-CoA carboxylase carboxyltransferase subunit alpha [Saccharopolyspora erythraea]|uniref:acetyl-CoA carboxylase carboxyltransferase subunit alpha n=1 Tax=Saccharopolyspora erythraea TaxID=1836 RepID=UPI001BAC5EB0|nr:acetyl-CoA carboxylase carboxyltransferase subunit alpha [Saccharopolyspora erythraea]QUG99418.1 acetyl-CoA carboxylase carboxyltransferase subunit alpha [Saccharopolyspora erythraea]